MSGTDAHILVVEDEEAHVELIRRAFGRRRRRVRLAVARKLTEARTYLTDSVPDLVLADLVLPDGKGTELLPGDKENLPYPVVVMTSYGDEQAAVEAMKAGALDYVVKSETTLNNMPYLVERALREWSHIVERREAEKKLRRYQKQLRSLASELSLAEERERRRVAVGLHDDVCQKLALAKLTLESLRQSLSYRADKQDEKKLPNLCDMPESLDKACAMIDRVIEDAHSLTFELSSPVLYELGFEAAVGQWLSEQIEQKYGVRCKFNAADRPLELDDALSVTLFQAVRELLVNVVRHAKAHQVEVSIRKAGNKVQVAVKDNGTGFEPNEIALMPARTGGFGLFSIRERLEYLGGGMKIQSAPGQGTCVTLIAPAKRAAVVRV